MNDFYIVFEPKDKAKFNNRRRFFVGVGNLSSYIGDSNAKKKKRFVRHEITLIQGNVH